MPKKTKTKKPRAQVSGGIDADEDGNGGDAPTTEQRFGNISREPMFREMPKKNRVVVVDDRFKKMFEEDGRFHARKAKVDRRGRRISKPRGDDFIKQVYLLGESEKTGGFEANEEESGGEEDNEMEASHSSSGDEDEDDEFEIKVDLARGEGNISSSSSDEEDSSHDEEDEANNAESAAWGELERNVRQVEWASERLAVCNLDWDRLKAEDLMTVLESFKPTSGKILSVAIYLSDFGHERMEEEKEVGPRFPELMRKLEEERKKSSEISEELRSAIRAYQLERLRHYYAVCECDNEQTAAGIYEECDGAEYESSGVRFDLRFIPSDMQFDASRLRERITLEELNLEKYKPKRFESSALSSSNAKCSWDEDDPERQRKMFDAFRAAEDADLRNFDTLLAPPSDEDEEEGEMDSDELKRNNAGRRQLLDILRNPHHAGPPDSDQEEESDDDGEFEEEVAFEKQSEEEGNSPDSVNEEIGSGDGESDEDELRLREAVRKHKGKTPFQLYLERKKQIKKERKDREAKEKKAKKRRRKDHGGEPEEEDSDEPLSRSKASVKQASQHRPANPGGTLPPVKITSAGAKDTQLDPRFSALFTNSAFAIDKTHARFKGGRLADEQVLVKAKSRKKEMDVPMESTDNVDAKVIASTLQQRISSGKVKKPRKGEMIKNAVSTRAQGHLSTDPTEQESSAIDLENLRRKVQSFAAASSKKQHRQP